MIRNIWAVGRNYRDHAKEMRAEIPTEPMFFLKAGSCAFFSDQISIPPWATDVHHEIEIALQLGEDLQPQKIGLALDLTERKLQSIAKNKGLPWTLAKSFIGACPLSSFVEFKSEYLNQNLNFNLKINGELNQTGSSHDMIFSISDLVAYVHRHFPLCPSDLILTGTPQGVGPINKGQILQAEIVGILKHQWTVN